MVLTLKVIVSGLVVLTRLNTVCGCDPVPVSFASPDQGDPSDLTISLD